MTSNNSVLRPLCGLFAAALLAAAPGQALAVKWLDKSSPIIMQLDTTITSLELIGEAALPLGPDESLMDTGVRATNAQDYNSSRSNNINGFEPPHDDTIDLKQFDGLPMVLAPSVNLGLDLLFSDLDSLVDFIPGLGDEPIAMFTENAILRTDSTQIATFDLSKPDYGILEARGWEHRGHVTVLKIAFGGGGGFGGDLDAGAITFNPLAGTSEFSIGAAGEIIHAYEVEMSMSGAFNGVDFSIPSLRGRVVEEGRLIVGTPEPATLALVALAALPMARRRRR